MGTPGRTVILLLTLLTSMSTQAQPADYSKMSALVRRAAVESRCQPRRATAKESRQQHLTAFVKLSTEDGDTLLTRQGARVLSRQGDIVIADIPTISLPSLSAQPQILRIEAGRPATALMDTTATIVNALPAYHATPQHGAFTGRGVVVGLMDVGFDLTHPNFFSNAAATGYRIRALWDQLSPDTTESQLPVGRDFTTEEELLALGCSTNGRTQTHGTHTLGIAAGSGFDTNYRGVAYESDICLVSNAVTADTVYIAAADYYRYTTATDALGFQYLFDYADRQGKPCVASFSEGYVGMNDADDLLFAQYLDRLSSPGHIIVVSAGNQGHLLTYAAKPPTARQAGAFITPWGKEATYTIRGEGLQAIHLYCYANGSPTPTDTLTISSGDSRTDSLLTATLHPGSDTLTVCISRHQAAFGTGIIYQLSIAASRNINQLPRTAIVLEGEGEIELFGSSSSQLANIPSVDSRWSAARRGHGILAPAWFPSAICVGSTAHRLSFVNYLGEVRGIFEGREAGFVSPTSSRGPTVDGRTKPDVCAPGDNIISSYSSYYLAANPQAADIRSDVAHFTFRGRAYAWNANAGTSMSCPIVAGAIALWLQAKPTLTREEILAVFSRTCRQPDASLTYPNCDYGYGEIDVYRGLLDILGLTQVEAISSHQPAAASMSIAGGILHIALAHPLVQAATVGIYSLSGRLLEQHTLEAGTTHSAISVPRLQPGIYAVQLSSADSRFRGSALISCHP